MGTSDVPQVGKQFVAIKNNQKGFRDVMKNLTNKVKDVVVTFYAEISDIVALVKIMMMAIGDNSQRVNALK